LSDLEKNNKKAKGGKPSDSEKVTQKAKDEKPLELEEVTEITKDEKAPDLAKTVEITKDAGVSGLDKVIKKIQSDAEAKAVSIIREAEAAADKAKQEIIDKANKDAARILTEAELAATRLKEQIKSGNSLEIRNKKLAAKQKVIDKVFADALTALIGISQAEFEKFVASYCKDAVIKDGDQIILPEKYKSADVKKINPKLTVYTGNRNINGGFILISGGVEQNNTFAALLDYYRNDLEPLVISKLF